MERWYSSQTRNLQFVSQKCRNEEGKTKLTNDGHMKRLRVDHDVIGLKIAMAKSVGVHVRESANDLSKDFGGNRRRHRRAIDFEQFSEGHCRLFNVFQEFIVVTRRLLMVDHPIPAK